MNFFSKMLCLTLAGLFFGPVADAGNVTVGATTAVTKDTGWGSVLSDWGIEFDASSDGHVVWPTEIGSQNTGTDQVAEANHTVGGFSFRFAIEDYVKDNTPNAYVGPRYGGQNYDAEFLGVGIDMSSLVIALVSGQRPDNTTPNYSPGDLYISTSTGDVFGIEMTGQTFNLKNNGHTKTVTDHGDNEKAGTIWKNPVWKQATPDLPDTTPDGTDYAANPALKNVQINHDSTTESSIGMADLYFSGNTIGTQHSVFELSIETSIFGGANITGVHWSPSCGNDLLYPQTNLSTTPEPASAALFGLGLCGLGGFVRRKKKRQTTQAS